MPTSIIRAKGSHRPYSEPAFEAQMYLHVLSVGVELRLEER